MPVINTEQLAEESIDDMINEEFEKAKEDLNSYYSSKQPQEITHIIEKISSRFASEWENVTEESIEALIRLLNRLSLDDSATCRIFENLEMFFQGKVKKCLIENAPESVVNKYTEAFSGVESVAKVYYEKRIIQETANLDLPERLTFLNKAITEKFAERNKFKYKALLDLKQFIDREFQFIDQEVANRNLLLNLGINDSGTLHKNEIESNKTKANDLNLEEITMRRKVLTLMLLTFGRLDSPEGVIKERIVKFFHNFTGGDLSKLRKLIANPTAHTAGNKQSINYLCDELNNVRKDIEKLGLSEKVEPLINEIDSLITDLEEEEENLEERNKKNKKISLGYP